MTDVQSNHEDTDTAHETASDSPGQSTLSLDLSSNGSFHSPSEENKPELSLVIDALRVTVENKEAMDARADRYYEHGRTDGADKDLHDEASSKSSSDIAPPTPGLPSTGFLAFNKSIDGIADGYSANAIEINSIELKEIRANILTPQEQERADEPVLRAVHHLFNNRFMKAKKLFERYSEFEPLHALGLASMAFLKALMTMNDDSRKSAIKVLMITFNLAKAQINVATNRRMSDSVRQYFTSYYNYVKFMNTTSALPTSPSPATKMRIKRDNIQFIPNGVLRAHVAKAECCLQIAVLQLLEESASGYIKCGLNLRRAYTSYSLVWQEYKRMGQLYNDYIDRDTVSGIQFGIGTVHLLLASLPQKILRIVSAFGWKADRNLGFALLKLCIDGRRIRAPMASLMLLGYYTTLTTLCPQLLASEYTQPAIETLLEAQRTYPNSAFFLFFAGRTSRLARNLSLSSQSFTYAMEISKNEWAEVETRHLCQYETALNYMMQNDWEKSTELFGTLYQERYWSPAVFRYLQAACSQMLPDKRMESILAYADVPDLVATSTSTHSSGMDQYVLRKVNILLSSGYQDLDMAVYALEYLCIFNAFDFMAHDVLETNLALVDEALRRIADAETIELNIRTCELLPDIPPPNYFDQRGVLLLIKVSIQSALHRYEDAILHLNWIIDCRERFTSERWVVPFAYWEAGVTSWAMDNKYRACEFWNIALKYSKYDFEYRLSVRLNLALARAEELGYKIMEKKDPSAMVSPISPSTSATTATMNAVPAVASQ